VKRRNKTNRKCDQKEQGKRKHTGKPTVDKREESA
jgi:hypothetical protein